MRNEIAIYKDFDELERVALALYKSGYFQDVKSEAQAIVKVMAGKEVGIPAFASMAGIHIINGKPVLGANVIATLVKNDPRYDYRIKQADDRACILTWYEDGKLVGEAGFTIQEAQNAGLTGKDNWKKWTSDMLFARAISRGSRRFAPGIFGGAPVYTPDEMGMDTDEDGYIDVQSVVIEMAAGEMASEALYQVAEPPAEPAKHFDFKNRPYDAETLKAALAKKVEAIGAYEASEKQRNFLGSLLNEFYQDDAKRHEASFWLFGAESTKEIDGAMVKAALDWLNPVKDDGGAYVIDSTARSELSNVTSVALLEAGQQALL
jgi:hypothetical protein